MGQSASGEISEESRHPLEPVPAVCVCERQRGSEYFLEALDSVGAFEEAMRNNQLGAHFVDARA